MSRPVTPRRASSPSTNARTRALRARARSASKTPRLLVPMITGQNASGEASGIRQRSVVTSGGAAPPRRRARAAPPGVASRSAGLMWLERRILAPHRLPEERLAGREHDLAPHRDRQPPAGREPRPRPPQHAGHVVHEEEPEDREDGVEGRRRDRPDVSTSPTSKRACVRPAAAASARARSTSDGVRSTPSTAPGRADRACRRQRRRAGAAAQVEHALPRRQRAAAAPCAARTRARTAACRSDRPPPCRWRRRGPCRSSLEQRRHDTLRPTSGAPVPPRGPRRTSHSTMEARALSCRFTTG